MTQKEILELALSGAIEVWADFRFLAGLDGTDACYNYRCSASDAEVEQAKEQMEIWSKKCDWIQAQIDEIDKAEKAARRAERNRRKLAKVAA